MSELTELYEQIAACQRCELSQGRTQTVPGEGPEDAEIMFIGEAPGFHEDRQGRPFVGAAGKFLEELLASIGLTREDVYIANVIKCRPPGNRDPLSDEIAACKPFLDKQIELIQPKLIVTLGRFSMARYFPNAKITRIHGQPKRIGGRIYYPMFHPAAALHQPKWRSVVKADMLKIPQILKEAEQLGEAEPLKQTEQLSLF
jgi:uracil-DNA glycosylase family 4